MDISIYFQALDTQFDPSNYEGTQVGYTVRAYLKSFPEITGAHIALIGVEEGRNANGNEGCDKAPDQVRKYLYKLFHGSFSPEIIDLGNIKPGHTVDDTYYAVSSVISYLVKKNIVPVIIGGGQDLTYANFSAYQSLEQLVNIVSIDNTFDLGGVDQPLDSQSYLSKIILHQPNFLFNYSNIGYQTYLVDQNALDLMSKLYFDVYRLGYVHANIEEVEPIVRNADILSFDVSSIRMSDAPGNANAGPNGFYGEEACQIVRYAGLSDKLSSIGFYEINPEYDRSGQTCHLVAQMIWCFMDGYYNRKKDFPVANKSEFTKYRVNIQDNKHEIVFYKSPKSDRWWMDVPYPQDKNQKYERHHMVPCSYTDYQTACREDMPDRWWQTFQKLS